MTLGEMKAQFVGLMNRNELKGSQVSPFTPYPPLVTTFISSAILRIQRELRVPMMEKTIVYTIPNTYVPMTGIAIPNDFLELIGLFVGTNQEVELQRGQTSKVKSAAAGGGTPTMFTRLGANWIIGGSPMVGDVITIQYYSSFPAYADDTASNTLSTVAWDAVVYGALSAACDYWNDERLDKFEKRYSQITMNLQGMADGDELTADAAVGPVYDWPDDGNDV